MTLSMQPYKGARDFFPEDKRLQNYMFTRLKETCAQFGYEEYDAPILEPTELYLAKGNQEIIDEQTYTFIDRGGRSVTIRTEMTPTVSRMVASRRQELAYPVRWFSIPNVWRYERMQRGRLREFWQLNADIFGVQGIEADHEVVLLADRILKNFGAKPSMYSIRLNSRKLMSYLFREYLGLDATQEQTIIRLIDRMKKMEQDTFMAHADAILTPSQRDQGVLDSMLQLLKARRLEDLPASSQFQPAVLALRQLFDLLDASHVESVQFDVTLMRGFDYYTDIVFEVFDEHPENNRSMFGGGRYDGLVGQFGVETVPTVGFGMGDVTLENFLRIHELLPHLSPEVDAYIIPLGPQSYEKGQRFFEELRKQNVRIAIDTTYRKVEKQIKSADKRGLTYVVFVGETELQQARYKIKNIRTGDEEEHGIDRLVAILKDHRRQMQPKMPKSHEQSDVEDEIDIDSL